MAEKECKRCKGHGVIPGWAGTPESGDLQQTAEDCPDCDAMGFEIKEHN